MEGGRVKEKTEGGRVRGRKGGYTVEERGYLDRCMATSAKSLNVFIFVKYFPSPSYL